ncbi:FMN-binding protein [Streptomyces sp. NPDC003077]|uniref:FMN-binding protein n=1 Tax=Streptomyces sp. NPDC003077 TaxID=3154443 RepID=UPI0033AC3D95
MRKAAATTLTSVVGIVLLLSLKPHQAAAPSAAPAPSSAGGPHSAPAPAGPGGAGRTFTGDVVGTPYGPVQVAVTLKGGRIVTVKVLQVPSGNGRDREIAATAVPRLTQEALNAQSARVDAVSGATYTSEGYVRSLQSALDQAHGHAL